MRAADKRKRANSLANLKRMNIQCPAICGTGTIRTKIANASMRKFVHGAPYGRA